MTEKTISRVCIYGAGAIGGWIGAGLAGAGCRVSVVARGATLQALQQHGLRVQRGDAVTAAPVQASATRPSSACRTWWSSPSRRRRCSKWRATSAR